MNSTTITAKDIAPWYKQGWPWFLIFFPALAVVAGFITLAIALDTSDGLVVDDYYKEGTAIVQEIGRIERARELGLSAQLNIRSDMLRVELSGKDATTIPERILVTVTHPTQVGKDQTLSLHKNGEVFEGAMAPLGTGRWLFHIEDETHTWRMSGATYLPTETNIKIDPSS